MEKEEKKEAKAQPKTQTETKPKDQVTKDNKSASKLS